MNMKMHTQTHRHKNTHTYIHIHTHIHTHTHTHTHKHTYIPHTFNQRKSDILLHSGPNLDHNLRKNYHFDSTEICNFSISINEKNLRCNL